jgi:predicted dehydrogenase
MSDAAPAPIRIAVVGAGAFGKNHLRILQASEHAELVAAVDADPAVAEQAAVQFNCRAISSYRELAGLCDAAVISTPTSSHEEIAGFLMDSGIDVLIEKPIAPSVDAAERLTAKASAQGRILQVGHLERFNPAVRALEKLVTLPLFFEVHRLSVFSPRSLDVDVVLDLMIHDLEIVLALTGSEPEEIRASGISILSKKVDIANVRLQFPGGIVANLTASRVSTERVRKLRLFQPSQYISIDYGKQELLAIGVTPDRQVQFLPSRVTKDEPLRLEIEHFLECIRTRQAPLVGGPEATRALRVAEAILTKIEEHSRIVEQTIATSAVLRPS